MDNLQQCKDRVTALERELEDMTMALTQAWDQLVPFLQEVPPEARTTQDIAPILTAVAAAADTELAGIFLFQSDEWFSVPETLNVPAIFRQQLAGITKEQLLVLDLPSGERVHWALAPVRSEQEIIGTLGIGTRDPVRTFTAVDLRIVMRMAERIGSQIAVAQLARIREREAILARELKIAYDIQESIQPSAPPKTDGVKLAAYWKPAKTVGGDAWGWVQQPNGALTWFVLDVAGKGLPAALAAVSLHTAISMVLRMGLSPVDALRTINTQFYDPYTRTDLMATVAVVALHPKSGVMEIANAGHPPILIRHQRAWVRLPATVPPIGVLPEIEAEAQVTTLKPNDIVLCSSDGFTEIQTATRLWGQTGLLSSVPEEQSDAARIVQDIVSIADRSGTAEDDQTLVVAVYE